MGKILLFFFIQFQVDRNGEGQEMKSNNKFEVGENGETKVQRRTKPGSSEGLTLGDRR